MTSLTHLQPQALWQWFEQICSIPHPSEHEQALSQHIQHWVKQQQLTLVEDRVGNLIIKKPATAGMEDRKTVALQAHLDMVPQKNNDTIHDFLTDPITPYVDGDWVKATGTTLGADNGIGMASALAILAANDIEHGPLEVLLTVNEEAGMHGAFGLESGYLDAEILINTDSEQEGEIYMGCAGGADTHISLPIERTISNKANQSIELSISGLKGGHSGVDIHLGRGNANKLLARFLFEHAKALSIELAQFSGGSLRNAIPREAQVTLTIPTANRAQLEQRVNDYQTLLQQELSVVEPDIQLNISEIENIDSVLTPSSQTKLINLIHSCPNGVVRMSDDIDGVVETSLNLGVISSQQDEVSLLCLTRSLIDSGRENIESQLSALSQLAGANAHFSGTYPGWKPDSSSPVMALVKQIYQDIYHKEPVIMVIHAGLECGLFKKPYPEMDMVSIGPTIRFPHSPDEKVEIKTVEQYFNLLLEILKQIPKKG